MITGYKKKKLGHPSEKLSGDVPRASWRAVIFSEVIFPVFMAVLLVIAYMFVKSFPNKEGVYPPSPLIRIAVISIGPIVWNAAILLVLFLVSLFLGPILDPIFPKFGSVIAFIAHILGVIGMLGFFEFLWFLESWDVSHAVLGLICVIAIQRAVHKILISVFLTREFKHDETNRAWWTGRWYGRGLGTHVMSQPAREFIVKIIELSLWSSDLLLGHLLLFILTPPILIPYFDRFHATLLCEFSFPGESFPVLIVPSLSLAPTIETNSCSVIFHQAEAATTMDYHKIWSHVYAHPRLVCRSHRSTCKLPH
jgi:1,3-beta-glucan synthase